MKVYVIEYDDYGDRWVEAVLSSIELVDKYFATPWRYRESCKVTEMEVDEGI